MTRWFFSVLIGSEPINASGMKHSLLYRWTILFLLRYMAPEIFKNLEYDGRQADIWSVAMTLLLCFTGLYAWEAPTPLPGSAREVKW